MWSFRNGVFEHDCMKMRETILEHESVFRNQLLELHRLYGRQKELMDEIRRGNDRHLVHEKFPVVPQASFDGDTELSLRTVRRSPCNINAMTLDLVSKAFSQNLREVTNWENSTSFTLQGKAGTQRHLPCNFAYKESWLELDHSSIGEFFPGKSSAFLQSQNVEPRIFVEGQAQSSQKRKLFGVEISETNDVSVDIMLGMSTKDGNHQGSHCLTSWPFNSFVANGELEGAAGKDGKNEVSCLSLGRYSTGSDLFGVPFQKEESRTKFDENSDQLKSKPADNLPWFLRKLNEHDDLNKAMKSSYFMNTESLQNNKHSFFKKAEPENMDLNNVIPPESASPHAESDPEKHHGLVMATRNAMIPTKNQTHSENEPTEVRISGSVDEDGKDLDTSTSDMRYQIDLNLSLDDEDSSVEPRFTTIVKIATTGIDLEAPVVDESDANVSPKEAEEFDRLAAEAIIVFSLHKQQSLVDVEASHLSEDAPSNDLKWFAELIFSEYNEMVTTQVDEELVPEGMDHFEFMTLKLEDCKGKNYDYQPVVFDDEKSGDNISTRTRKQTRRGKPRKDFQRDILPGMVTLSRFQVSEDLQSFEELMKAKGKSWQSGLPQRCTPQNRRGRKLTITLETPPKAKRIRSSNAPQHPPWQQLKEVSLAGWGKRTRRLPRQRCANNGFVASPVKC